MLDTERQWLTTADLAHMFDMSEATIRRWARQRRLPHFLSPGGQYRFDAAEIQILVEQRSVRYDRCVAGGGATG
jgi:excisionase family DNA binding protein